MAVLFSRLCNVKKGSNRCVVLFALCGVMMPSGYAAAQDSSVFISKNGAVYHDISNQLKLYSEKTGKDIDLARVDSLTDRFNDSVHKKLCEILEKKKKAMSPQNLKVYAEKLQQNMNLSIHMVISEVMSNISSGQKIDVESLGEKFVEDAVVKTDLQLK